MDWQDDDRGASHLALWSDTSSFISIHTLPSMCILFFLVEFPVSLIFKLLLSSGPRGFKHSQQKLQASGCSSQLHKIIFNTEVCIHRLYSCFSPWLTSANTCQKFGTFLPSLVSDPLALCGPSCWCQADSSEPKFLRGLFFVLFLLFCTETCSFIFT